VLDFYQQNNFFTEEESLIIDDILYNQNKPFPIYYDSSQTDYDKVPFFSHALIARDGNNVSNFSNFFIPIFNRFIKTTNKKVKKILRASVNLTLPFVGESPIHVDHDEDYYQVLMYLNNSTGNTDIFENEKLVKSIKPVKGKIVLFNKLKHQANSPKNANELRAVCVVTFNT